MPTKKSVQEAAVESTDNLFTTASEAGESALQAFGNVRAKARAFILASYTAIVSARALDPADHEAVLVRRFDEKGFDRPQGGDDVHRWFRAVAPAELIQKDKFKSTRSTWKKAISNALAAKLTPDDVKALLERGGIYGLCNRISQPGDRHSKAGDATSEGGEGGPSDEQQREMDAEQDRPEELAQLARGPEAREQVRKAHAEVQTILNDPQQAPSPISPYREAVEVSAEEIVSAIRQADRPVWCLAVVRVDPVRKRGEGTVNVAIESSSIDLLTADPRKIRTALKSMKEEPERIGRSIVELVEVIRGAREPIKPKRSTEERARVVGA